MEVSQQGSTPKSSLIHWTILIHFSAETYGDLGTHFRKHPLSHTELWFWKVYGMKPVPRPALSWNCIGTPKIKLIGDDRSAFQDVVDDYVINSYKFTFHVFFYLYIWVWKRDVPPESHWYKKRWLTNGFGATAPPPGFQFHAIAWIDWGGWRIPPPVGKPCLRRTKRTCSELNQGVHVVFPRYFGDFCLL